MQNPWKQRKRWNWWKWKYKMLKITCWNCRKKWKVSQFLMFHSSEGAFQEAQLFLSTSNQAWQQFHLWNCICLYASCNLYYSKKEVYWHKNSVATSRTSWSWCFPQSFARGYGEKRCTEKVFSLFLYVNYFVEVHLDFFFLSNPVRSLSFWLWCLSSEYSMANGMRQMFDPFERVARAHHYCPCCERPFSPEEEDQFVRKVNSHTFCESVDA